MPAVDWKDVGLGAGLGLAIALVVILVFRIFDVIVGVGDDSNWPLLFALPIVAGWAVVGRFVGARHPEAPFTHGLFAALGAYAVLPVYGIAVRLATDRGVPFASIVFFAMVAVSAGILGALWSTRSP